jgi:hypothetical protein
LFHPLLPEHNKPALFSGRERDTIRLIVATGRPDHHARFVSEKYQTRATLRSWA